MVWFELFSFCWIFSVSSSFGEYYHTSWFVMNFSTTYKVFFMANIFLCEPSIWIVNWPIFQCGNANFSAREKKPILTPRGRKGGQNWNSDSADVLSFVNYSTMLNFKSIGLVLLGYLCLVRRRRRRRRRRIGRNNSKPSLQLNWGWSWARLTKMKTTSTNN